MFVLWKLFLVLSALNYHNLMISKNKRDMIVEFSRRLDGNFEYHDVVTEDGYILKLLRVLTRGGNVSNGEPILLMHGFGTSFRDYLYLDQNSLPFILSNAGYDVWLGNSRGNNYCNRHKFLTIDSAEYWNFSIHELGLYDLPAKIDYILEKTNRSSLAYFGHSQAGGSLLILLSMKPEYQRKIKEAHLVSPGVFLGSTPPSAFWAQYDVVKMMYNLGHRTVYPTHKIAEILCGMEGANCPNLILSTFGYNKRKVKLNLNLIPVVIDNVSEFVAAKQYVHVGQMRESKKFQMFDYGKGNWKVYGTRDPPEYNLSQVMTPISLYQGSSDILVMSKDVQMLSKKLPNVRKFWMLDDYNHMDCFYSATARNDLYLEILNALNSGKYGN